MKKWLFSALFALALMVCIAPAQAAVVSGGVEYVWYTGEEGFYISCDQGGSYAVLPELETARERTGLAYAIVVEPNANDDGGLSVKGRDIWSTEYTWFQEYSAQELAVALRNRTKVTPVRVHATNGTVTVGSRYVKDYGNDDLTRHLSAGNLLDGEYAGDRIVYSADGVTWLPAEGECALNWLGSIWWDGSAFRGSDGHLSEDGIHWSSTEEKRSDPSYALACELGPYRFEVCEDRVYLMARETVDAGVLLPHMGQAARTKGVNIGALRAWYGPNDTVILAAYDLYGKESLMVSIDYPISSLDWCLENLSVQFRTVEAQGSNGTVSLGIVERRRTAGAEDDRELVYDDGSGWKWVENVPWGSSVRLGPYNGKTFVATSASHVYASEGGLSWREVEALYAGSGDYTNCDLAWTGKEYIARRHTGTSRSGMFGMSGGGWQKGFSEVYLLNEDFQITSAYDFGRLVESVGWLNGNYYAKVANSEGHRDGFPMDPGVYDSSLGSTLYRSADGKTWERLPDVYIDLDDIMLPTVGGAGLNRQPTGDPQKPQRSIAQLDRWRFVLNEYFAWDYERDIREEHSTYRVCLMGDVAADWVELPHLGEAIKAQGIEAWELTAAYNPDGTVEVRVTDKDDTNKYASISYPTSSLDWVKENLIEVNGRRLPAYTGTNNDAWDIESKYGVADLIVVELANGENELVYRTPATGGNWKWFDSVPWGNEIALLKFSGKDFMVLDKADGRLYLSPDGVNWHEATGNWVVNKRDHNYWEYAFVWTGEHYLSVCMLADDIAGDGVKVVGHREWARESCEVACLDENLKYVRIANLDAVLFTTAVGCRDGICYVQLQDGRLLKSPNGGRSWLETDIPAVREALRENQ